MRKKIVLAIAWRDLKEILRDLLASVGIIILFVVLTVIAFSFILFSGENKSWQVWVQDEAGFAKSEFVVRQQKNALIQYQETKKNLSVKEIERLCEDEANVLVVTSQFVEGIPSYTLHYAHPLPDFVVGAIEERLVNYRKNYVAQRLAEEFSVDFEKIKRPFEILEKEPALTKKFAGEQDAFSQSFSIALLRNPLIPQKLRSFLMGKLDELRTIWSWCTVGVLAVLLLLSQTIGGTLYDYKSRGLLDIFLTRVTIDELISGSALYFVALLMLCGGVLVPLFFLMIPPPGSNVIFLGKLMIWGCLILPYSVLIIWFYGGVVLKCETLRQCLIVFSVFSALMFVIISLCSPHLLPDEAFMSSIIMWCPFFGAFVFSSVLLNHSLSWGVGIVFMIWHLGWGIFLLKRAQWFIKKVMRGG